MLSRQTKNIGDISLEDAAKCGKWDVVRELVEARREVDSKYSSEYSVALWYAIAAGSAPWVTIEALLKAGAKVTVEDLHTKGNAFHYAVLSCPNYLPALLAQNTEDVRQALMHRDAEGNTPLVYAAKQREWKAVHAIAEARIVDSGYSVALWHALAAIDAKGSFVPRATVEALSKAGAKVTVEDLRTKGNVLHYVVLRYPECLPGLLAHNKEDVEQALMHQDNEGNTPLVHAAKHRRWEAVRIIAEKFIPDESDKAGFAIALTLAKLNCKSDPTIINALQKIVDQIYGKMPKKIKTILIVTDQDKIRTEVHGNVYSARLWPQLIKRKLHKEDNTILTRSSELSLTTRHKSN